jgi:hypothetical protein
MELAKAREAIHEKYRRLREQAYEREDRRFMAWARAYQRELERLEKEKPTAEKLEED